MDSKSVVTQEVAKLLLTDVFGIRSEEKNLQISIIIKLSFIIILLSKKVEYKLV